VLPLQLYIHVPFCEKKCHYCDFASWESPAVTQKKWLEVALREIDRAGGGEWAGAKVSTIFFGGGTPSVVPTRYLEQILERLRGHFDLSAVNEMTLEANPSSLTHDKLKTWRALGFHRVSVGVQSFHQDELTLLGRVHTPETAEAALELLSSEPGLRYSADLIFGLPGQTPERFLANLERLLRYNPDHISFYGLTIEAGTAFDELHKAGRLVLPEGEQYQAMYEGGVALLARHGLGRYEVSNFARAGQECRHNQGYWNGAPWLAFGPGAHGFDGRRRWMNPRQLEEYLAWGDEGFPDAAREWDELDDDARLTEAVSLGLRQARGFSLAGVERDFGATWDEAVFARFEAAGYARREDGFLRLSDAGWPLLDEIAADLLAKARAKVSVVPSVTSTSSVTDGHR
jgi:oxygen-independent coproporphyrinogen-3 oxidase